MTKMDPADPELESIAALLKAREEENLSPPPGGYPESMLAILGAMASLDLLADMGDPGGESRLPISGWIDDPRKRCESNRESCLRMLGRIGFLLRNHPTIDQSAKHHLIDKFAVGEVLEKEWSGLVKLDNWPISFIINIDSIYDNLSNKYKILYFDIRDTIRNFHKKME